MSGSSDPGPGPFHHASGDSLRPFMSALPARNSRDAPRARTCGRIAVRAGCLLDQDRNAGRPAQAGTKVVPAGDRDSTAGTRSGCICGGASLGTQGTLRVPWASTPTAWRLSSAGQAPRPVIEGSNSSFNRSVFHALNCRGAGQALTREARRPGGRRSPTPLGTSERSAHEHSAGSHCHPSDIGS
jgi:hypothetical protein